MIHVLKGKASDKQVWEMTGELGSYIKLAVDVSRGVLAGGGAMHADCEAALLDVGSRQEDVWGADWIPASQEVRFESLINIRPRQGNRSMDIEDTELRKRVEAIVLEVFGGTR
jgi:hypothetical protein